MSHETKRSVLPLPQYLVGIRKNNANLHVTRLRRTVTAFIVEPSLLITSKQGSE